MKYVVKNIEEAIQEKWIGHENLPDSFGYGIWLCKDTGEPKKFIGHDIAEPEDKCLARDLEWVVDALNQSIVQPIEMLLDCPKCGLAHVDEGEWATRHHRTHLCARCGELFRPSHRSTVGVRELPPKENA